MLHAWRVFLFSLLLAVVPKETWLLQICLLSLHILFNEKLSSDYLAFSSHFWQALLICDILLGVFQVCSFSHNFPLSWDTSWTFFMLYYINSSVLLTSPALSLMTFSLNTIFSHFALFLLFFVLLLVHNELSPNYSTNTSLVSSLINNIHLIPAFKSVILTLASPASVCFLL